VALWDLRAGERGGCVQRINAFNGGSPVYAMACIASGESHLLALTGAERSVVCLEPRKWGIQAKWQGAVK
jgi:hypothetical protein